MQAGSRDIVGQSYKDFCHDYGIPAHLTFDEATEKIVENTLFMKLINNYGT